MATSCAWGSRTRHTPGHQSEPPELLRRVRYVMYFEFAMPQEESLVADLIREVQRIARVACKGVPEHVRVDVESAAMVGLMEALRHFEQMDPEHFRRYLHVRVRGALVDEARHFDPLSRSERRWVRRVEQATDDYRKAHGHSPEMADLARALECDEDACWSALELSEYAALPIIDETLDSQVLTPEDSFVQSYSAAALRWALAQLEQRQRLVLRLAYKRGLSLAAIAKRLDVSAPRAYQIRVEAEQRLERLLRKSPPLTEMPEAAATFDWDECTENTLRDGEPRRRTVSTHAGPRMGHSVMGEYDLR